MFVRVSVVMIRSKKSQFVDCKKVETQKKYVAHVLIKHVMNYLKQEWNGDHRLVFVDIMKEICKMWVRNCANGDFSKR